MMVLDDFSERFATKSKNPELVRYLISRLKLGADIDAHDIKLLQGKTKMLPTRWQTPLSIKHIKSELDKYESEKVREVNGLLPDNLDSDWFDDVFEFRTKSDRTIRESRFRDTWYAYKKLHLQEQGRFVLINCLKYGWDNIAVLNLLNFVLTYGEVWFSTIQELGMFPDSLSNFQGKAKLLSDIIKTGPVSLPDRFKYVELSTLGGYRNPPYPGFDLETEVRDLAEGEYLPHEYEDISFEATAYSSIYSIPRYKDGVSFEIFVKKGMWLTAGSSSIGKVNWTYDIEKGHFKARKNMLFYLYTEQDLWEYVNVNQKQQNTAIIKSELGKIRLAIASDLATYLRMSWIDYHLNSVYLTWSGSTMAEDLNAQSNRLTRMLTLLRKKWGLPFDYKGFDHQPTTKEIKIIVRLLCDMARFNIPASELVTFNQEVDILLRSFDDATISLQVSNIRRKYLMRGGLGSGLRWTSTIGNAWNTIITNMAMRIIERLGVNISAMEKWIRGDDSAIITEAWITAYLMIEAYTVLGVKAGDGKFSIWYEQFEFLRQWFDNSVHAYASRVLPGWVQRKPWNSQARSAFDAIRRQGELRYMLIRRGLDPVAVNALWEGTYKNWCRKTRISERFLELPSIMGGLGLNTWKGYYSDSLPKEVQDIPNLQVDITGSAISRLQEQYRKYDLIVTDTIAAKMVDANFQKLLATDDVPGIASVRRKLFQDLNKGWKPKWVKLNVDQGLFFHKDVDFPSSAEIVPIHDFVVSERTKLGNFSFGLYAKEKKVWDDISALSRYIDVKVMSYMSFGFQQAYANLRKRRMRKHDVLAWLFGETEFSHNLNPVVSELVQIMCVRIAGNIERKSWPDKSFVLYIYQLSAEVAALIGSSSFYQTLYVW